jgi:hypothetical protein
MGIEAVIRLSHFKGRFQRIYSGLAPARGEEGKQDKTRKDRTIIEEVEEE